jgi:hypothetical protein
MTLFDVLSDVMFFKRGDQLQTIESESDVNPYMLNRWMSMHSPKNALLVNEYNNRLWPVFQNKKDWYRFCLAIVPRNRFTKIEYIKKGAKEKSATKADDEKVYQMLAKNLELSVREVKSYVTEHGIDLSSLRKVFKNDK